MIKRKSLCCAPVLSALCCSQISVSPGSRPSDVFRRGQTPTWCNPVFHRYSLISPENSPTPDPVTVATTVKPSRPLGAPLPSTCPQFSLDLSFIPPLPPLHPAADASTLRSAFLPLFFNPADLRSVPSAVWKTCKMLVAALCESVITSLHCHLPLCMSLSKLCSYSFTLSLFAARSQHVWLYW